MNLLYKTETFVGAILAIFLLFATARAEVVDRIVANVNGQIILYSELQHQVAILQKRMPTLVLNDPEQKAKVEREVLEQIIQQKLADMEVKRLKITVSDSEVDAKIRDIQSTNHLTPEKFQESLKASGGSLGKFREQLKETMERQQLLQQVLKSQVVISDQEVDAYLKWREGQQGQEGQGGQDAATGKVHLALIVLPVGGANGTAGEVKRTGAKLLSQLQRGADFRSVAQRYSKGPTAQEGGDVGYMAPDDIAPFIAKAIKGLQNGQVSNLVQGPDGYYIVKLLDVGRDHINIGGSNISREKARQMLYEQAMSRKYEQWLKNLESKAFIQISL